MSEKDLTPFGNYEKFIDYIYDVDDSDIFARQPDSSSEDNQNKHDENQPSECIDKLKDELTTENENLKELLKKTQAEKELLQLRISELYKTAKSELERKDNRIKQLEKEKDSILFRRQNNIRQRQLVVNTPYSTINDAVKEEYRLVSQEPQLNIKNSNHETDQINSKNPTLSPTTRNLKGQNNTGTLGPRTPPREESENQFVSKNVEGVHSPIRRKSNEKLCRTRSKSPQNQPTVYSQQDNGALETTASSKNRYACTDHHSKGPQTPSGHSEAPEMDRLKKNNSNSRQRSRSKSRTRGENQHSRSNCRNRTKSRDRGRSADNKKNYKSKNSRSSSRDRDRHYSRLDTRDKKNRGKSFDLKEKCNRDGQERYTRKPGFRRSRSLSNERGTRKTPIRDISAGRHKNYSSEHRSGSRERTGKYIFNNRNSAVVRQDRRGNSTQNRIISRSKVRENVSSWSHRRLQERVSYTKPRDFHRRQKLLRHSLERDRQSLKRGKPPENMDLAYNQPKKSLENDNPISDHDDIQLHLSGESDIDSLHDRKKREENLYSDYESGIELLKSSGLDANQMTVEQLERLLEEKQKELVNENVSLNKISDVGDEFSETKSKDNRNYRPYEGELGCDHDRDIFGWYQSENQGEKRDKLDNVKYASECQSRTVFESRQHQKKINTTDCVSSQVNFQNTELKPGNETQWTENKQKQTEEKSGEESSYKSLIEHVVKIKESCNVTNIGLVAKKTQVTKDIGPKEKEKDEAIIKRDVDVKKREKISFDAYRSRKKSTEQRMDKVDMDIANKKTDIPIQNDIPQEKSGNHDNNNKLTSKSNIEKHIESKERCISAEKSNDCIVANTVNVDKNSLEDNCYSDNHKSDPNNVPAKDIDPIEAVDYNCIANVIEISDSLTDHGNASSINDKNSFIHDLSVSDDDVDDCTQNVTSCIDKPNPMEQHGGKIRIISDILIPSPKHLKANKAESSLDKTEKMNSGKESKTLFDIIHGKNGHSDNAECKSHSTLPNGNVAPLESIQNIQEALRNRLEPSAIDSTIIRNKTTNILNTEELQKCLEGDSGKEKDATTSSQERDRPKTPPKLENKRDCLRKRVPKNQVCPNEDKSGAARTGQVDRPTESDFKDGNRQELMTRLFGDMTPSPWKPPENHSKEPAKNLDKAKRNLSKDIVVTEDKKPSKTAKEQKPLNKKKTKVVRNRSKSLDVKAFRETEETFERPKLNSEPITNKQTDIDLSKFCSNPTYIPGLLNKQSIFDSPNHYIQKKNEEIALKGVSVRVTRLSFEKSDDSSSSEIETAKQILVYETPKKNSAGNKTQTRRKRLSDMNDQETSDKQPGKKKQTAARPKKRTYVKRTKSKTKIEERKGGNPSFKIKLNRPKRNKRVIYSDTSEFEDEELDDDTDSGTRSKKIKHVLKAEKKKMKLEKKDKKIGNKVTEIKKKEGKISCDKDKVKPAMKHEVESENVASTIREEETTNDMKECADKLKNDKNSKPKLQKPETLKPIKRITPRRIGDCSPRQQEQVVMRELFVTNASDINRKRQHDSSEEERTEKRSKIICQESLHTVERHVLDNAAFTTISIREAQLDIERAYEDGSDGKKDGADSPANFALVKSVGDQAKEWNDNLVADSKQAKSTDELTVIGKAVTVTNDTSNTTFPEIKLGPKDIDILSCEQKDIYYLLDDFSLSFGADSKIIRSNSGDATHLNFSNVLSKDRNTSTPIRKTLCGDRKPDVPDNLKSSSGESSENRVPPVLDKSSVPRINATQSGFSVSGTSSNKSSSVTGSCSVKFGAPLKRNRRQPISVKLID